MMPIQYLQPIRMIRMTVPSGTVGPERAVAHSRGRKGRQPLRAAPRTYQRSVSQGSRDGGADRSRGEARLVVGQGQEGEPELGATLGSAVGPDGAAHRLDEAGA